MIEKLKIIYKGEKMTQKTKILLILFTAILIAAAGCAPKQEIKPEATPMAEATQMPTAVSQETKMTYDVKKGDCLWKISSMSDIYGDPFEWPLLFRANRDQIQDPDIIEVNQELQVKKDFSKEQTDKAIEEAKETPPYKPHSQPRKKLPLKY